MAEKKKRKQSDFQPRDGNREAFGQKVQKPGTQAGRQKDFHKPQQKTFRQNVQESGGEPEQERVEESHEGRDTFRQSQKKLRQESTRKRIIRKPLDKKSGSRKWKPEGRQKIMLSRKKKHLPESRKISISLNRIHTEIAYEKKKAEGKEFTYDDVKRKVQIRRGSYKRNQELLRELIVELNRMIFTDDN